PATWMIVAVALAARIGALVAPAHAQGVSADSGSVPSSERVMAAPSLDAPAATDQSAFPRVDLSLVPEDQSVYEPAAPPNEAEGTNTGGANFDLVVTYLTDYVYRGVNHSKFGTHHQATNLGVDVSFSFNLGKFPHPFLGVF